ncbi:MAG: hypothetical protein KBF73_06560 [Flavobacteriales bacterium]|nr:hypothetical protein [Flavobacteriales bacterium]
MKSITPSSPLLTLVVEPKDGTTTQNLLAQFHPIMKSLGFGHFEMEKNEFYAANKEAGSIIQTTEFVFAEIIENQLLINLDGRPLFFGLKKTENDLIEMGQKFEETGKCSTRLDGPNTGRVLLSNLMFTWIPMLLGVVVGILAVGLIYHTDFITEVGTSYSPYFWTFVIAVSARTRFWSGQRRKKRPVWIGLSILFLAPVALFLIIPLVDYLFSLF